MKQDTFAGDAEHEPMLVSELLADLGVADAPWDEQRTAVHGWLAEGNEPSRMLALALRARGFPSPLSIDGEDFARELGFHDVADEIAEIKAQRPTRKYLSVGEIADELGCSREDVQRLIEARQLPAPIRGGLISRAALDAFERRLRGERSPVVELPAKSNEELRQEFIALSGGITPEAFYAQFAAGEIEDTSANMSLLVKAVALEGDHPCPVLNCRGLDELGNCPMGYTRSCMARVKAMQELAESAADPEDL